MKGSEHRRTLMLALCIALLSASIAVAADPPVTATFATTGTAKPGATVNTKATIKINDGSSIQSLKWNQIAGVSTTLANTTTDTVGITFPALSAFRQKVIGRSPRARSRRTSRSASTTTACRTAGVSSASRRRRS